MLLVVLPTYDYATPYARTKRTNKLNAHPPAHAFKYAMSGRADYFTLAPEYACYGIARETI